MKIRERTAIKEIPCRFGRWKIPGEPKVILVGFGKKYDKDQLLFRIWEDYGVDSIAGGWDYVEPVMFSYACGEVIETVYNLAPDRRVYRLLPSFMNGCAGRGFSLKKKGSRNRDGFYHPCHNPWRSSRRLRGGHLCGHGPYLTAARSRRP